MNTNTDLLELIYGCRYDKYIKQTWFRVYDLPLDLGDPYDDLRDL